eukprot:2745736-Prymnesium_polylepis.2
MRDARFLAAADGTVEVKPPRALVARCEACGYVWRARARDMERLAICRGPRRGWPLSSRGRERRVA